jgi:hypothetical protein
MAINKIVFFCTTPFTKRDYDRLGGDVLKENGLDVWYYDFSLIVYPQLYKNCSFPDLCQSENHLNFLNEREGLKAIAELPSDCLVITARRFFSSALKPSDGGLFL